MNLSIVFVQRNVSLLHAASYLGICPRISLISDYQDSNIPITEYLFLNNYFIFPGYFVHIHSIEEVQQQVLKYINVIARPMILAKEDPPPTWTHANIDYTVNIFLSYRL